MCLVAEQCANVNGLIRVTNIIRLNYKTSAARYSLRPPLLSSRPRAPSFALPAPSRNTRLPQPRAIYSLVEISLSLLLQGRDELTEFLIIRINPEDLRTVKAYYKPESSTTGHQFFILRGKRNGKQLEVIFGLSGRTDGRTDEASCTLLEIKTTVAENYGE